MENPDDVPIGTNQDVLAFAADIAHLSARETTKRRRINVHTQAGFQGSDALDRAADDMRPEAATNCFHFREFRHRLRRELLDRSNL